MISELANHLWQSTLFAVAVGLLTLMCRQNHASVRYWLWFSASVKFFIPFTLLMALGGALFDHVSPAAPYYVGAGVVTLALLVPALWLVSGPGIGWMGLLALTALANASAVLVLPTPPFGHSSSRQVE